MVDVTWVGSPNFYGQSGVAKSFVTLHQMVGTLSSTDRAFNGPRKASATYGVGPSAIHQYVHEKDYPFSDGNTYANQHTISIEHEGGWLDANGNRVPSSAPTLELSAQLLADIARRHGWKSLQWMGNVFPHKHWVATACPVNLDQTTIINRANQLLGANVAALAGVNSGTSISAGWNASSWSTKQIQAALIKLGYNLGPTGADNNYGTLTAAGVKQLETDHGLTVDIGIAGPQVVSLLAKLTGSAAPVARSNKLVVDGRDGILTTKAEQRALGVAPDGQRGPNTIGAEQLKTGARHDRIDGPDTTFHLQSYLIGRGYSCGPSGTDRVKGVNTVKALQRCLNDGKF